MHIIVQCTLYMSNVSRCTIVHCTLYSALCNVQSTVQLLTLLFSTHEYIHTHLHTRTHTHKHTLTQTHTYINRTPDKPHAFFLHHITYYYYYYYTIDTHVYVWQDIIEIVV